MNLKFWSISLRSFSWSVCFIIGFLCSINAYSQDCEIISSIVQSIKARESSDTLLKRLHDQRELITHKNCLSDSLIEEYLLVSKYLAYHKQLEFSNAITYKLQEIYRSQQNYDAADERDYTIALRYIRNGMYEKGIAFADSVLEYNSNLNETKSRHYFNLHNAIAFATNRLGQMNAAKDKYEFVLSHDSLDFDIKSIALNNLLSIYNSLYLHKELYIERTKQFAEAKERQDTILMGLALQGIAQMYAVYNAHDQTIEYLNRAIELIRPEKDIGFYLSLNNSLILLYLSMDSTEQARYHIEEINALDFETWDYRHLVNFKLLDIFYDFSVDNLSIAQSKFDDIKDDPIFNTDIQLAYRKDLATLKLLTSKEVVACSTIDSITSKYVNSDKALSFKRAKEIWNLLENNEDCLSEANKTIMLKKLNELNKLQIKNLNEIKELENLESLSESKSFNSKILYAFLILTIFIIGASGIILKRIKKRNQNRFNEQLKTLEHEVLRQLKMIKSRMGNSSSISQNDIEQISEQVQKYFSFHQLQSKKVRKEEVLLFELFEDIIESLNIESCTSIEIDKNLLINTDVFLLRQALENILENSKKFTQIKDVKAIIIKASQIAQSTHIEIIDNGIGFDFSLYSDSVFEKNVTVHPKAQGSNSGLGLYITKSIVDQLKGELSICSEENIGTTVIIKIPSSLDA